MNLEVRVSGDKGFTYGFAREFDTKLKNVGSMIIKDLAYRTNMSLILRAPKSNIPHEGVTLRKSIKTTVKSENEMVVSVGEGLYRPYGYYQEFGYAPHHVSVKKHPEVAPLARGRGAIYVSKHTPFIQPALNNLQNIIDRVIVTYIEKGLIG